jgi:hypothetical protein
MYSLNKIEKRANQLFPDNADCENKKLLNRVKREIYINGAISKEAGDYHLEFSGLIKE